MNRLSKQHFWVWFKRHSKEYDSLQTKTKKEANYWLNELTAHLRTYFRYFEYSFSFDPKRGISTIYITVKGRERYFKKVDAMVEKAPKIPGWEIKALECPVPAECGLEDLIKKTGIDPLELFFTYDNSDPDYSSLTVYHPLCTKKNKDNILDLANGAVYNLLGERIYGTEHFEIMVENLSTVDKKSVKPLEELSEVVGKGLSEMVVDGSGKLESNSHH